VNTGRLAVGLRATVTAEVGEADTADALGSGDLPVLGTPRLLALAEAACVAAVAPHLADGQTTVGSAVSLEHKRPSPIGSPVEVQAELTDIDDRTLFFMFVAYGPGTGDEAVIGAGTVQRVLVDRERFLRKAGVAPGAAPHENPPPRAGESPGARATQTPVVDLG
jgi:fluoroacetyl-CoA thioesterase